MRKPPAAHRMEHGGRAAAAGPAHPGRRAAAQLLALRARGGPGAPGGLTSPTAPAPTGRATRTPRCSSFRWRPARRAGSSRTIPALEPDAVPIMVDRRPLAHRELDGTVEKLRLGVSQLSLDPAGTFLYLAALNGGTVWRVRRDGPPGHGARARGARHPRRGLRRAPVRPPGWSRGTTGGWCSPTSRATRSG